MNGVRNAGFLACLMGALAMISGRYMPQAPHWLTYAGLSGIVFGWGMFGFSMYQRGARVRTQASEGSPAGTKR